MAIWAAISSALLGVAIAVILIVFFRSIPEALFQLQHPGSVGPVDIASLSLSAVIAIWVWSVAAKQKTVERKRRGRFFGYLGIWLLPVIAAVFLAFIIRSIYMQPFQMAASSMQPALQPGDYFVAEKRAYGYSRYSFAPLDRLLPKGRLFDRPPQRGDIVVFHANHDPGASYVKRLVGAPGDRIQMIGGVLFLNGEPVERALAGYLEVKAYDGAVETVEAYRETLPGGVSYLVLERGPSLLDDTSDFTVPADHYFMLGDDRDRSNDSRMSEMMGFIPFENLLGKVETAEISDPAARQ